jgi:hypothetical protein
MHSMSITEDLIDYTNLLKKQVKMSYRQVDLLFVIAPQSLMKKSLFIAAQNIEDHPCHPIAERILQQSSTIGDCAFIGIAAGRNRRFFPPSIQENILALFRINIDKYTDSNIAKLQIGQLLWQALELIDMKNQPEYQSNFKNKAIFPIHQQSSMMPATLSDTQLISTLRSNLKADSFSATLLYLNGKKHAISALAKRRAMQTLDCYPNFRPELYPYPLAAEPLYSVLKHQKINQKQNLDNISTALAISGQVSNIFDIYTLKKWYDFCMPLQEMAWRGYTPDINLSCALNGSNDAFIKSNGYLIQELTGIEPKPFDVIENHPNFFRENQFNQILHEREAEQRFERVIQRTAKELSSAALLEEARRQNYILSDGIIIGWCASAMQAAGKAYDQAWKQGKPAEPAARLEFATARQIVTWDQLKVLSNKVIETKKQGIHVDDEKLIELTKDIPQLSAIRESVEQTMERRPKYTPEIVQELTLSPTKKPEYTAPIPQFSVPTLGGGMMGGSNRTRQVPSTPITDIEKEGK